MSPFPIADFAVSLGVTSRYSPASDTPLSWLSPPCSHPSSSPRVGLGSSTFKALLDHKSFVSHCLGVLGHCHQCVSLSSVQRGSNSAWSVFLRVTPQTRPYLQLWAELTWLSLEEDHPPHLKSGSHLTAPPLSDWSSHWHKQPQPPRGFMAQII